ncbi:DUF5106 domain-containing protein [Sphingobacterium alkalisoli]|uniref:DUF5106 domain-containing protein n=1 Tax=Sphingobacterium alkalisoli TaxID=1874115 RepID=A0A4U0GN51_9SPHI|nr:DUF5106 domain-containing protein [Sphingobacterium alkalisoli]TJY60147.1 DUF5106 domain-containing protein [Sphingobacterium alkalisoli]GGH32212.1 hypothetical protein GCM10011418_45590 [Sphingobacterium alkalisoli]
MRITPVYPTPRIWVLLFLTSFAIATSCGSPPQTKKNNEATEKIPSRSALDVQIDTYWDRFDFSDSSWVVHVDTAEQALVDYLYLLQQASAQKADSAMRSLLARAKRNPKIFDFFNTTYQRYLYDPNSPMRNEKLYESVLGFGIDSTDIAAHEKDRLQAKLRLIRRNNPGEKAENFSYQTRSGSPHKLYDLQATHLLLLFYEPGCASCEETIETLKQMPAITEAIQRGSLNILAIYATGNLEVWQKHQNTIPDSWIDGIDTEQAILGNNLYDLKASPTMYLLDHNKKVILKDAPLGQVMQYLQGR